MGLESSWAGNPPLGQGEWSFLLMQQWGRERRVVEEVKCAIEGKTVSFVSTLHDDRHSTPPQQIEADSG